MFENPGKIKCFRNVLYRGYLYVFFYAPPNFLGFFGGCRNVFLTN